MVFFKYGFIFLAGAAVGTAMAHRGQHHRHGHCWRRHWDHRGGDRGRWHEQEPAQQASYDDEYQQERRGGAYSYGRSADTVDSRDTEEREHRRSVKNKKSSAAGAAAATSDY